MKSAPWQSMASGDKLQSVYGAEMAEEKTFVHAPLNKCSVSVPRGPSYSIFT